MARLKTPFIEDPLDIDKERIYKQNKKLYYKNVIEWINKYSTYKICKKYKNNGFDMKLKNIKFIENDKIKYIIMYLVN